MDTNRDGFTGNTNTSTQGLMVFRPHLLMGRCICLVLVLLTRMTVSCQERGMHRLSCFSMGQPPNGG